MYILCCFSIDSVIKVSFHLAALPPTSSAPSVTGGQGQEGKTPVDPLIRGWRNGPAKVWYDMLGLSEDGAGLDYGFKMKVYRG